MSRTQIQLWYNRFKEGRGNVNGPGRPTTSTNDENIETVKKIISDKCRITITEVADDIGISFGSCQAIFTDVLGMKHPVAKILSKLLNFEQKQRRIYIAQEMFRRSTSMQICSKRL